MVAYRPSAAASGDCNNTFGSDASPALATQILLARGDEVHELKNAESIAQSLSKRLDGAQPPPRTGLQCTVTRMNVAKSKAQPGRDYERG